MSQLRHGNALLLAEVKQNRVSRTSCCMRANKNVKSILSVSIKRQAKRIRSEKGSQVTHSTCLVDVNQHTLRQLSNHLALPFIYASNLGLMMPRGCHRSCARGCDIRQTPINIFTRAIANEFVPHRYRANWRVPITYISPRVVYSIATNCPNSITSGRC